MNLLFGIPSLLLLLASVPKGVHGFHVPGLAPTGQFGAPDEGARRPVIKAPKASSHPRHHRGATPFTDGTTRRLERWMELPHAFWEVSAGCEAEEEQEMQERSETEPYCREGGGLVWAPAVGCISHHEALELLQLRKHAPRTPSHHPVLYAGVSLDLGKSESTVWITFQGISVEDNPGLVVATWEELQEIVQNSKQGDMGCYALYTDGTKPWRVSSVSLRTGRKAALHPLHNVRGPPTVILGSFTMHRVMGDGRSRRTIGPVEDTRRKLDAVKMKKVFGRVLDTATGLGYTAIAASKCQGVSEVVTIEVDGSSLEMCRYNPWSSELFEDESIRLVRGDVCEVVKTLPDHAFAAIVHDPPVMSLSKSSCIYGLPFYAELYRVLRWRGRLFHYVGNPNNKATRRLYRSVIQKLESVGFQQCTIVPSAYGIVAEKGQDRKSSKRFLYDSVRRKKDKSRRRRKGMSYRDREEEEDEEGSFEVFLPESSLVFSDSDEDEEGEEEEGPQDDDDDEYFV